MKPATAKALKTELAQMPAADLVALCLRLVRFKKENKELLSYLLFEAENEAAYVLAIKNMLALQFAELGGKSNYYFLKSVRKILRETKKHIRYSQKKETETELLLYFCTELNRFQPYLKRSTALKNLYLRQLESIKKNINSLHEDLQFDYLQELQRLQS